MGLGMHRCASRHTALSPVERESRRRTWWVLYFFDRFSASKIGQPLTIRDEDIDVEMPSMDGLTQDEMAEDPQLAGLGYPQIPQVSRQLRAAHLKWWDPQER